MAARRDEIEIAPDDERAAAAVWQRAVRLRALEREPPRAGARFDPGARLAGVVALALHIALLFVARPLLRVAPPGEPGSAIEVRLVEPAAPAQPAPAEPTPVSRPSSARPRLAPGPAPDRAAPSVPEAPGPAPPLRLFGIDGSASIPDGFAAELDRARLQGRFPQSVAPSALLAAKRPLKVRPNYFAQYWAGTDGKPLHETMWQHVMATREFTAPWGGRWGCTWVLIVVACADIPDKAWTPPQTWKPATELDER